MQRPDVRIPFLGDFETDYFRNSRYRPSQIETTPYLSSGDEFDWDRFSIDVETNKFAGSSVGFIYFD